MIRFSFSLSRVPALLLLACLVCAGSAWAKTPPTLSEQHGVFPTSGRVILRSGLEWLNEDSPIFRALHAALVPLLNDRGLTVVDVPPSILSELPQGLAVIDTPQGKDVRLAQELFANDPGGALFAESQLLGRPLMFRGGRIPGKLPAEMREGDEAIAEYALVARFSAVSPLRRIPGTTGDAGLTAQEVNLADGIEPTDFVTAAGTIRGVGTMGYGPSTPGAPPRSSYGNTPGDFNRGYEGNSPSPGDPWNREADFKARNYQFRHGPQPQFATPPRSPEGTTAPSPGLPSLPKPPLPGDRDMPAGSPGSGLAPGSSERNGAPGPGSAISSPGISDSDGVPVTGPAAVYRQQRRWTGAMPVAGFALEMEVFALAPVLRASDPKLVWRSIVQQRADAPDLEAALPGMAAIALADKGKKTQAQ